MAEGATTPRDRFREQTRGEIKAIALRQLSEGGIGAIALTRIAKELGLSGPALYRYYAGRDELISALVRDAYDDLAAAVSAPAEPDSPPRARLLRLGRAYRAWAREQPHRYLLIFGSPLPGYAAPPDTVANARAALEPVVRVFAAARPDQQPLVDQLQRWNERDPAVAAWTGAHVEPAAAGAALAGAVTALSRLHGIVGLEVNGQFAGMGHDPGELLDAELGLLADTYRLP
ncbi:TetR/AcrR family transcriptional regulator [Saccharopolyspora sp. SCSIO 74807]|uniref:TetR/AcrR family transcriptional regulator n=1 Tax=Saccharopolyspora sp. SCSIO 74807 TaxID=3118084 RepID=UPI0030D0A747